jgi:predicted amidohydrolase
MEDQFMANLRVTGIQMVVGESKSKNLPKMLEAIKGSDCDFILFPEMSLTGYNNGFSTARTEEAWQKIGAACRQSYVTAVIGTGVRPNGYAHIQSRIFSDEGELLGFQEKLVPTESDRDWCRPGEELRTFENKGVRFGCLVSNDLWVAPGFGPYADPRLSYRLGKEGAQIIFHSVNSGTDPSYSSYYDANLRLRARESNCYIVTVNAAVEEGMINVPSGVVSPQGEWLVQCSCAGEQKFSYDLDLEVE